MGFMSPAGYPGFGDRTCRPDLTPPRYGCTTTLGVFDKSLVQFITNDEEASDRFSTCINTGFVMYDKFTARFYHNSNKTIHTLVSITNQM